MSAPVAAYVRGNLVESFSIDPRQLHEGKDGGYIKELSDGRYRVRCKGQHCGVINRNNRRYGADETWGKHTRAESAFAKRVAARRVTGQLEHPSDGKSSMGLAAVVITEVSPPDPATGVVMVTFETMSTAPGRIVESYIRDGVGFGLSSRGNGSVVEGSDGVNNVQGDFEPITFDTVIDESTPGAEVPSRLLKEAHAVLDGCRQRLMESAEGDESKAKLLAEAETVAALGEMCGCNSVAYRPDHGGEQVHDLSRGPAAPKQGCQVHSEGPHSGHSEYLLGLSDGTGHYRASLNGKQQWDVYLLVHNLGPEKIAADLPTMRDAKGAAEAHAQRIVRESYTVDSNIPYSGTMMVLRFDSGAEAKKAKSVLEKAGFNSHPKGDDALCIYTSYEDPEQAEAHILRVLGGKKIEPRDESFGVIRRGRVIWEDTMADHALLQEINAKLDRLNEEPMDYEDDEMDEMGGMDYEDGDEDMYEEEGDEYDDLGDDDSDDSDDENGDEYDDLGVDEPGDDEVDEDDDEYDDYEMDEDGAMDDDPDVEIGSGMAGGDHDSDIPESAHSFIDVPRKRLGETVGVTRIFMDEDENVVGTVQLSEAPQNRGQMKAMFARELSTKAPRGKGKKGKKGKPGKARGKASEYTRTFRHNNAVDNDLNVTSSVKGSRTITKAQKKANASKRKKATAKRRKGKNESVGRPRVSLRKLIEATSTLLRSPYQKDVLAGLRMVNERAADWPENAQTYVLEAMQSLHQSLSDDGLSSVVEAAARHLMGDTLDEGDEHEFDIDEEGLLDEEDDDDYDDHDDTEVESHYESYIQEMEVERARLSELVAAQSELNQALAAESKVTEWCLRHPVLETVRTKLAACETAQDVEEAAASYLDLVHESTPAPKTAASVLDGRTAPGTVRIGSKSEGSLNKGTLEENINPSLAGRKARGTDSTSSRVAKYRRRQKV